MSSQFYNLTVSASLIGISRQALYPYLKRYHPIIIAGYPVLSSEQIKLIKAERKQRGRNGNKKVA